MIPDNPVFTKSVHPGDRVEAKPEHTLARLAYPGERVEAGQAQPEHLVRRLVQPGEETDQLQGEPAHFLSRRPAYYGDRVEAGQAQPEHLVRRLVQPGEETDQLQGEPAHFLSRRPAYYGDRVEAGQAQPEHLVRRLVQPGEETDQLQGEPAHFLSRRPVEPALESALIPEQPLLPRVEASSFTPMTSAYFMDPSWQGVHVDGVPLAPGYHLQGFTTFADGTSRVDANLFQSISPLAPGLRITGADGLPLDLGDHAVFVVKENPAVDPTAPGYQPLYVSFAPDGTAVPIVTGF
ncbi:hypothetical protein Asp14428_41840 [Actinoplanes sp. NBRC 14428]|nr:hypothetical protein Asp14428_41840 [Actinoplanes sp. NBRC 14428]